MSTADKPIFKTGNLAEALGMTTQFIRDQVRDGKLHASVNKRFNGRRVLRFSLNDVRAYDQDAAARLSINPLQEASRE